MIEYKFDENGLRYILELAFKHGYSEGYSTGNWDVDWPASEEARNLAKEEIECSDRFMNFGAILGGEGPLDPYQVRRI